MSGQAALQGPHDRHGAHAVDQAGGDKSLGKAAVIAAEALFQLQTKRVEPVLDAQQLADDAADDDAQGDHHGILSLQGHGQPDQDHRQADRLHQCGL